MAQFKKRVFGENVPKDVINEIKKLAGGGGKEGNKIGSQGQILIDDKFQPLQGINPTFEEYLGDRTPFSRMWCAVNINTLSEIPPDGHSVHKNSKNEYFYYVDPKAPKDSNAETKTIGYDKDSETRVFVINDHNGESYGTNDLLDSLESTGMKSLQQVKQLQNNQYMKPAAGITSVTSKTQGALGALQNTTVEFVVHNKHDFETIFLPYFLKPGSIVCVDYGWSDLQTSAIFGIGPSGLYNPIDQIKDKPLDMSEFDEFLYGEGGFLAQNYGKVNTTMGNVISYEASITAEGSYNCSLEIVSRNTSLLDKEVSEDNQIKFIFANSINDILVGFLAARGGADVDALGVEDLINLKLDSLESVNTNEAAKQFLKGELEKSNTGVLPDDAIVKGIFYHQMANNDGYLKSIFDPSTTKELKEIVYISYGLFEDLFLNNFVVGTIPIETVKEQTTDQQKNEIKFTKDPSSDYSNRFDSRKAYVRWDENFEKIQTAKISPGEELSSFMIPKNWDNSYNSKTLGEEKISTEESKMLNDKKHPIYDTPVVPFRDVFVSVPLITQAFKTKETVNDALIFILDQLNLDSHKVWNLKLSGDMDSKSGISITDSNLLPKEVKVEEMLTFDVTGETSIVSQCDLKFTTPKAGLSSMIAISNLHGPQQFGQLELNALNNLNLLNKPNTKDNLPTVVKSLPLQGVTNEKHYENAINLNFSKFIKSQNKKHPEIVGSYSNMDTAIETNFKTYRKNVLTALNSDETRFEKKRKSKTKDTGNYDLVDSDRSYFKDIIRKKYHDESGENKISPILPIELDLSVYGNRFLQIGDFFNINYLPEHYKKRVFFQIIGIEDKMESGGWQTSYTSIMRVNSKEKTLVNTAGNVVPDVPKGEKITLVSNENDDLSSATTIPQGVIKNVVSAFTPDDGKLSLVQNFTLGYTKVEVNNEPPGLNFDLKEYHIAPHDEWATEDVDQEVINSARFFNTIGEINIQNYHSLAFSCALRDLLLKKGGILDIPQNEFELIFYNDNSSKKHDEFTKRTGQNGLKAWAVVQDKVDEILDLPGFDIFNSANIKIQDGYKKVIQDITRNYGEDYWIPKIQQSEAMQSKDHKIPPFISQYTLQIQGGQLEDIQKVYKLILLTNEKTPITVFNEIVIPKWLLNKEYGSINETFVKELRRVYFDYYIGFNSVFQESQVELAKLNAESIGGA